MGAGIGGFLKNFLPLVRFMARLGAENRPKTDGARTDDAKRGPTRFGVCVSATFAAIVVASAEASPAWAQIAGQEWAQADAASACPGFDIAIDASIGGTPVVSIVVGGRRGNFLIDTGATQSAVDAQSYDVVPGTRSDLDGVFAGQTRFSFLAGQMRSYRAPPHGQQGRIGTDVLSQYAVVFSYQAPSPHLTVRSAPCDADALKRAGYSEIGLPGHYASEQGRRGPDSANVPVIGLSIGSLTLAAQIDTGFADESTPYVIQANAALLTALRNHGVAMHPLPAASTLGCAGVRTFERWQVDATSLRLTTTNDAAIAIYPPPLLEIKDDVACGGIAALKEPFGQIGASWLKRWRTTIVDGPSGRVWVPTETQSNADPKITRD
jgi:hypothetical protein